MEVRGDEMCGLFPKHAEFLSSPEMTQCNWANWLVEQVLCGEWDSYLEQGFAEEIEELLLLTQGKVWQILKDGYMRYEYGEIWVFDSSLLRCLYGDSLVMLPLKREVVIIDRDDFWFNTMLGGKWW